MSKECRRVKTNVVCTLKEINDILFSIKDRCIIQYRKKSDSEYLGYKAFIWQDKTSLYVLAKFGGVAKKYKFALIPETNDLKISGALAFRVLSQYVKIQRVPNPSKYGTSAGILYKNKRFHNMRIKAYAYDINSAFSTQMLKPIPDTSTLKEWSYVGENQIGFIPRVEEDSRNQILDITFEKGRFCRYVCDLIESPFKKFVENYYKKKKNAKTLEERKKYKDMLNFAVGSIQNYNPFIRACIIGRSNMYIKQFIDKNTIYANTDSIVSCVKRPDIEELVGDEIGQRKFVRDGDLFAWKSESYNYQWNLETPKYRGVPKSRFATFEKVNARKFDILIDEVKDTSSFLMFDKNLFQVREAIYGKEVIYESI